MFQSHAGAIGRHLLEKCDEIKPDVRTKIQEQQREYQARKAGHPAPKDDHRLISLASGSFDSSSLTLSMFDGVQMPSVYEAGLISPQMKQLATWYHEEVRKQKEEQEEKRKQKEMLAQLGAVNGDPSTIDWSKFEGKIPSVYEASLISPQMKQLAMWYQEAMTKNATQSAKKQASTEAARDKAPKAREDAHGELFIQYWQEVRGEKYSRLLEEAIRELDVGVDTDIGEKEFSTFFRYASDCRTDPSTANISHCHCCYILIDDSKLSADGKSYWVCSFSEFLDAIFYIGKGAASRSMEHLKQAVLLHFSKHPEEIQARCPSLKPEQLKSLVPHFHNTKKLKYIKQLWDEGRGVTVFDGFVRALTNDEACSLEAAMLMAFGAENLQANRFGTPKSPVDQWGAEALTALGVHMLVRAYESFKSSMTHPHYERDFDKFLAGYVSMKSKIKAPSAQSTDCDDDVIWDDDDVA
ncbi:hypothetical protein AAVH_28383 [Aphelenchoides avenae]|nr:hypothetical protein AAVH_28383 [Aphelenchus avenae]